MKAIIKIEAFDNDAAAVQIEGDKERLWPMFCCVAEKLCEQINVSHERLLDMTKAAISQHQFINEMIENGIDVDVDEFLSQLNGGNDYE